MREGIAVDLWSFPERTQEVDHDSVSPEAFIGFLHSQQVCSLLRSPCSRRSIHPPLREALAPALLEARWKTPQTTLDWWPTVRLLLAARDILGR